MIPSTAELRVDCRVPPGLGEAEVLRAIAEVLGDTESAGDGAAGVEGEVLGEEGRQGRPGVGRVQFTERVVGNRSPIASPLMQSDLRLGRRAGSGGGDACR